MSRDDPRQRLAYDRTLLANERTFAAWIRTGISIAAVGFATVHLVPARELDGPAWVPSLLGGLLVFSGIGVIVFGAWRFARVNRDLTEAASPRTPVEPAWIYVLTAFAGFLLVLIFLLL